MVRLARQGHLEAKRTLRHAGADPATLATISAVMIVAAVAAAAVPAWRASRVFCSETHNPDNVRAWSRAARAQDRQFPYFGRQEGCRNDGLCPVVAA